MGQGRKRSGFAGNPRGFPLDQAALAHAAMEAGDHFGKIVLDVASL
ncbi:zinc-binding dehydrogenase [Stakelama sp. CBK3Z-3]|uniref:Zinc-binding dehydrogenase n=1 Tax=Stakelama flava TaxID=2860338 RepID=A0ABS6XKN8_9SPHN|nr:zinc-binding dehydrogenase [Stakelama flava]